MVVWSGPAVPGYAIDMATGGASNDTLDSVVNGTQSFACGDEESLCILYPRRADPQLHVLHYFAAVRRQRPLVGDLAVGRLRTFELRRASPAPLIRPSPNARPFGFGLRVLVGCADPMRTSLHWGCDARGCVLSTFRANAAAAHEDHWSLNGPFSSLWNWPGKRNVDLKRLLDIPPAALQREHGALTDLTRDLASELVMIIDFACGGGDVCSETIGTLRIAASVVAAAPAMRVSAPKARTRRDREFAASESGWVVRLTSGDTRAELACARHYHHLTDDNPPHDQCRVSLFARDSRLGDYFPYWLQQVELPDGGGIEVRGRTFEIGGGDGLGPREDQIVITGSALALAPD